MNGKCEPELEKTILKFINYYRNLYGTDIELKNPTSTIKSVIDDSQKWAKKLGSPTKNPDHAVTHQGDWGSRVRNGQDIILQASWDFDTKNSANPPGKVNISFPYFFEDFFERYRVIYQKFYIDKIKATNLRLFGDTVVDKGDLDLFDPFTRLLWATSKEIGIGCSQWYKNSKEKSYFYIVININTEIGNAARVDTPKDPDTLPPLPTFIDMLTNVKCGECARSAY